MNKNVKRSDNTYSLEDKGRMMETKLKAKKDIIRINQKYNKVLKDLEVEDLEAFEDDELVVLFDHKARGRQ